MLLYDIQAKRWVEVPDSSAAALISARTHAPDSDATYAIRGPDGVLGRIGGTRLLDALSAGAELSDEATIDMAERRFDQRGVLPTLRAAGRGALSGLTLGLAFDIDPESLLRQAAEAEATGDAAKGSELRNLAALHAEHGGATIAGELASLAAPGFAIGKTGRLARLLGMTPTGMVARAGASIAEGITGGAQARALASGLETARLAGGMRELALAEDAVRAGQTARTALSTRVAAGAAGAAAEGAMWFAAHPLRGVLDGRDPDLDAESIVAGGLFGASVGGAVGAALPALGRLASRGAEGVQVVAQQAFRRVSPSFGEAVLAVQRVLAPGTTREAQQAIGFSAEARRLQRVILDAPRIQSQATTDIARRMQTVEDGLAAVRLEVGDADPAALARVVDENLAAVSVPAAVQARRGVEGALDLVEDEFARLPVSARRMAAELGPAVESLDSIMRWFMGARKKRLLSPYLNEKNDARAASLAGEISREIDDAVGLVQGTRLGNWDRDPGPRFRGRMQNWMGDARSLQRAIDDRMSVAAAWEGPVTTNIADRFQLIDESKQLLGQFTARLAKIVDGAKAKGSRASRETYDMLERLERAYEFTRTALENQHIWGLAGRLQELINGPWSQSIAAGRGFLPGLLRPGERIDKQFIHRIVGDEAGMREWIGDLATPAGQQRLQAFREWRSSVEEVAAVMREWHPLSRTKEAERLIHSAPGTKWGPAVARDYRRPETVPEPEDLTGHIERLAGSLRRMDDVFTQAGGPAGRTVHPEVESVAASLGTTRRRLAELLPDAPASATDARVGLGRIRAELADYAEQISAAEARAEKRGVGGRSVRDFADLHQAVGAELARVDDLLGDASTWGEGAAAMHRSLRLGGHTVDDYGRRFFGGGMHGGGEGYRPPGQVAAHAPVVDVGQVQGFLRRLADPDGEQAAVVLGDYMRQVGGYGRTALSSARLSARGQTAARGIVESANSMEGLLRGRLDDLRTIAQYESLVKAEQTRLPLLGLLGGGAFLAGDPTAGAGLLGLAMLSRPATLMRQLGNLEGLQAHVANPLRRAARAIRRGAAAAEKVIHNATPRAAVRYAALAARGDDDGDLAQRHARAVAGDYGATVAPAAAAVAQRARAAYLASVPSPGVTSRLAWAAAEDMRKALRDPASKDASTAARARALREVYPKLRAKSAAAAAEASKGRMPPAREAAEIALLTGWSPDPLYRSDVLAGIQARATQAAQAQQRRATTEARSVRSRALTTGTERREP